jgi:hypothetical protein
MRPIVSKDDENNAFALFCEALYDDPDAFTDLIPDAVEPRPVAIAEDGGSAEFEIYAGRAEWWEPSNAPPIMRVLVERSGEQPN